MRLRHGHRRLVRKVTPVIVVVALILLIVGLAQGLSRWVERDSLTTDEAERINEAYQAERAADRAAQEAAEQRAITLAVDRPDGRPLRVLFAGDSLTVGWGAKTEAQSFRALLTRQLKAGGPVQTTRARAVSGYLYRAHNLGEFGVDHDLAVVEIGTNDLTRSKPGEFRREFAHMLDRIEQGSPEVQLICAGVWHSPSPGTEILSSAVDFNEIIATECAGRGASSSTCPT